jgi:hypothetical protein
MSGIEIKRTSQTSKKRKEKQIKKSPQDISRANQENKNETNE